MKAMLIPGNGGGEISDPSGWHPYVKRELEKIGIAVIMENMPDPILARKDIWLPFIEKNVGQGDDVILIGHSSGAVAIMRYLETHKVLGAVLVAGCYTDLGMESERVSNYYTGRWKWETIRKNAKWIIQFHSKDDPFIPVREARFIHRELETEYHEFEDEGHFGGPVDKPEFPELIDAVKKKL